VFVARAGPGYEVVEVAYRLYPSDQHLKGQRDQAVVVISTGPSGVKSPLPQRPQMQFLHEAARQVAAYVERLAKLSCSAQPIAVTNSPVPEGSVPIIRSLVGRTVCQPSLRYAGLR